MPQVTKTEYARILRDRAFVAKLRAGDELFFAMGQLARAFRAKQRYVAHKNPEDAYKFLVAFRRATGAEYRKG
jgi:hypothetical protein